MTRRREIKRRMTFTGFALAAGLILSPVALVIGAIVWGTVA